MKYTPQSLADLIEEIEEGYAKLQKTFNRVLESDQLIVGNYTFKDIIAHMACWEQFCIDSLEGIKNKTVQIGKPNIKKINLVFYEANKHKTLDEVRDSAAKTHRQLIKYLNTVDYQILSNPEPYYPDKNDIYTMITHCTTKHYPWAIKNIRKYQKPQKDYIKIRSAQPTDALGIATVHVKTWQCAYKGQIPDSYLDSLSIEKKTITWRKQIKNPKKGVHTFVAETNGQIVGWCTAGVNRDKDASPQTGELYGIYVLPVFIGQGIGSKLMEKALTTLKSDGYSQATLWVLVTNDKSRKWYAKKGWKLEGKTKTEPREDFTLNEIRYFFDLATF